MYCTENIHTSEAALFDSEYKSSCQSNLEGIFIKLINILISYVDLSHSLPLTTSYKLVDVHCTILKTCIEYIKHCNHTGNQEEI